MAELADALDLGSSGQPCGFNSHYPYHVAADDISSAATFYKSRLSLILSRLLSKPDPLPPGSGLIFRYQ